jgi:hypothetical protein
LGASAVVHAISRRQRKAREPSSASFEQSSDSWRSLSAASACDTMGGATLALPSSVCGAPGAAYSTPNLATRHTPAPWPRSIATASVTRASSAGSWCVIGAAKRRRNSQSVDDAEKYCTSVGTEKKRDSAGSLLTSMHAESVAGVARGGGAVKRPTMPSRTPSVAKLRSTAPERRSTAWKCDSLLSLVSPTCSATAGRRARHDTTKPEPPSTVAVSMCTADHACANTATTAERPRRAYTCMSMAAASERIVEPTTQAPAANHCGDWRMRRGDLQILKKSARFSRRATHFGQCAVGGRQTEQQDAGGADADMRVRVARCGRRQNDTVTAMTWQLSHREQTQTAARRRRRRHSASLWHTTTALVRSASRCCWLAAAKLTRPQSSRRRMTTTMPMMMMTMTMMTKV